MSDLKKSSNIGMSNPGLYYTGEGSKTFQGGQPNAGMSSSMMNQYGAHNTANSLTQALTAVHPNIKIGQSQYVGTAGMQTRQPVSSTNTVMGQNQPGQPQMAQALTQMVQTRPGVQIQNAGSQQNPTNSNSFLGNVGQRTATQYQQ
jgi:hypothetical protein